MFDRIRRAFARPAPLRAEPVDVYTGLRERALAVKREEVGIAAPPQGSPVWGLVMDLGVSRGTATLFALADGTASLYLSSGGGVLGGHAHEAVRRAGSQLLQTANLCERYLRPADSFTLPASDQVNFYALTDSGIRGATAPGAALMQPGHPLGALYAAAHGLISELRLVSQGMEGQA